MNGSTRRDFLSRSMAAGAVASLSMVSARATAASTESPNDTIRVGVIGVGGMGSGHVNRLLGINGARIVALCDADESRLDNARKTVRAKGGEPEAYTDLRHLLDNQDVDAVVIATPNHWHALATIWACQAGKDVYIEKPVTHNLWEGERVIAAARKHNRIVQAGTQNRSDTGFRQAIDYIRQGNIGDIRWVHGLWYKERPSLGRVAGPQAVPPGVDYNLWTGPAPLQPLTRKNLHYDWHWNWNTGNADMGNLGAHQLDDCVHVLGTDVLPKRFLCLGGRFARADDGETPNTQVAFLEFENSPPVVVEVRGLLRSSSSKELDNLRGVTAGNIVQCEGGYFAGGRGGGAIYDNSGKKIKDFPGDSGGTHMENWLQAIRDRDNANLRAEIAVGVNSANLCHLSNVAYRSGYPASVAEVKERVGSYDHAVEVVESIVAHLEANDVDLHETPLSCSNWMQFDAQNLTFSGGGDQGDALANALAVPRYREPFVVPAEVS